jgi:hypothetical protein
MTRGDKLERVQLALVKRKRWSEGWLAGIVTPNGERALKRFASSGRGRGTAARSCSRSRRSNGASSERVGETQRGPGAPRGPGGPGERRWR